MPRIELRTEIKASKETVFDLSRSIDLHKISTEHTNETAIAGKTSGLIGLDESVTWRAKHFRILGRIADKLFLLKYMTDLLAERNRIVKDFAETDKWKKIVA